MGFVVVDIELLLRFDGPYCKYSEHNEVLFLISIVFIGHVVQQVSRQVSFAKSHLSEDDIRFDTWGRMVNHVPQSIRIMESRINFAIRNIPIANIFELAVFQRNIS